MHPGTMVDAYSKRGILARAYAYGSQEEKSGGDCPVYADSLDSQKSESETGAFTFHIQKDKNGFVAVYCQQGYASRTETTNDNSKDGTRVQPDPVKLFPLQAKLPAIPPSTVAFIAIGTDMNQLRSNFRYYADVARAAFSVALEKNFAPEDRDLVEAIKNRRTPYVDGSVTEPQPRIKNFGEPDIAFIAIATELDNARSNFIYYEGVNKDAYSTARSKFPSQDQKIIERIRTRREPLLKSDGTRNIAPDVACLICGCQRGDTSQELIKKAWDALNANKGGKDPKNFEKALACARVTIERFTGDADEQQAKRLQGSACKKTPTPNEKDTYFASYWALSDVAAAWLIRGQVFEQQKNCNDAKEAYKIIISKYNCAYIWDPQGWFWNVAIGAEQALKDLETSGCGRMAQCGSFESLSCGR